MTEKTSYWPGELTRVVNQAFENTSTSIAAAQMRNALTQLAETVKDPEQKKVRDILDLPAGELSADLYIAL